MPDASIGSFPFGYKLKYANNEYISIAGYVRDETILLHISRSEVKLSSANRKLNSARLGAI